MAYPTFYPFKTRELCATSTSSNSTVAVVIPARSRYVTGWVGTVLSATQSAAGTIDLTVNGSTMAGMTGIAVTTSTGNVTTSLGTPTAVSYMNPGDILATIASSVTGFYVTHVIREF